MVARTQLLSAGLTKAEIDGRLRVGSLLLLFRGVYRVGHRAPSMDAGYMGAVLAAGPGALLSGKRPGICTVY